MKLIEIAALENGAHRDQTTFFEMEVPDGWAVIPNDMLIPDTYPFVDITVEDGIVKEMTAGVIPEPSPEPDPAPTTRELAEENKKLKAQIALQAEQTAFLEDCILEMADIVYA